MTGKKLKSEKMKRIRIRKSSGWKESDYVCLSISCGKKYHDNENLLAALDAAKQSGKPVIIDLSDSLQRYNFMACGLSSEQARYLANRQGNAWLELQEEHL